MHETIANASASPQLTPIFDLDGLIAHIEQTIKNAIKQPILPDAVYDYEETVAITGFSLSTVIRADRAGRLVGRYEGRRRYFMGRDILKWLADKREGGGEK